MSCYCVYKHLDDKDEVLYVGLASNLMARTGTHADLASWFKKVVKIEVLHFDSRDVAKMEEGRLIRELKPQFNVVGVRPYGSNDRDRRRLVYGAEHDRLKPLVLDALKTTSEYSLSNDVGLAPGTLLRFVRTDAVPYESTLNKLAEYFRNKSAAANKEQSK